MVDPWVLANDVIGGVGSTVLTPLLWVALFLWAWSRPADARASGFGRFAFWLLLPGAFLSSLADAPFLPWAGDVVAMNVGGALIPIALSVVLLHRELGTPGWSLTGVVILLVAAEAAIQFGFVLFTGSFWTVLAILGTAGAVVAYAAVALPRWVPRPAAMRGLTFIALVSVAIPLTFFTSESIPGEGIVSVFPLYLIAPVVVGLIAVWASVSVWGAPPYRGLGIGYGTATLGTLVGADVLREPPLYVGGGGSLLAIGGAGILDLVYFSGLMALGAGLLLIALRYHGGPSETSAPAADPLPDSALRFATIRLGAGDPAGAVRESVRASRSAADRVRSIFQMPASTGVAEAWDGLPVAPYVVHDYRNLVATQNEPTPTPREAFRSVAMASQFVRLGRDLSRLRFAPPGRRAWAAVLDLVLVTAPALVLWVYLSVALPGSVDTILDGLPFNVAVFAYIGYAALYYVACDALFGATPGKVLFHLAVTDRHLARPTVLQSLLRESPKAVSFFVIGELGAPALLFVLRSTTSPLDSLGVSLLFTGAVLIGITLVVVALALSIGGIQVVRDSERQRLGDRWASTWVVDRRLVTPAWGATIAPPAPAPPS